MLIFQGVIFQGVGATIQGFSVTNQLTIDWVACQATSSWNV